MTEKRMKNSYIVAILKTMGDKTGKGICGKRLPTKLLYAMRRSLPEVEAAYKAYADSLGDICKRYGTTAENPTCEDAEDRERMWAEITELMETETSVRVHTVPPEVLEQCGNPPFDSLNFNELDRLWWLLEEET